MSELVTVLLKISLVIFIAGNLLEMGLRLKLQAALVGVRNPRFLIHSVVWGFVLCPALAYVLTLVVPLQPPYAMGLLLVSMAPCSPFLPMVVGRAHGDLGYAASFMLLATIGTVVYMPIAVPLMVSGLTVSAWAIAKPLLIVVLAPMAIGMVLFRAWPAAAVRLGPIVRMSTGIATILTLVLMFVVYGKGFIGSAGSYATATMIGFLAFSAAASYALAFGLKPEQKCVLSLGICTRNVGAALAPLFAAPEIDQRAIIMAALVVPIMLVVSFVAAKLFVPRAATALEVEA